jgi:hypothetical protein
VYDQTGERLTCQLPDYFVALTSVYDGYRRELQQVERAQSQVAGTDAVSPLFGGSRHLTASKLRYAAYEAPSVSISRRKEEGQFKDRAATQARRAGGENLEEMDGRIDGEETALLFDSGEVSLSSTTFGPDAIKCIASTS